MDRTDPYGSRAPRGSRSGCSRSCATSAIDSGCFSTSTTSSSRGSTIRSCCARSRSRCSASSSTTRRAWRSSIGRRVSLKLQALTYTAGAGVVEPDIALTLDGSAAGITFRTGVARVFRKEDLDRLFKDGPPLLPPSLLSLCCVPLVTRRGTLGTLNRRERRSGRLSGTGSSIC